MPYFAMLLLFLLIQAMSSSVPAAEIGDEAELKKKIGQLLLIGFEGTEVQQNAPVAQWIRERHIGGVILFDRDFKEPGRAKNITDPEQLKQLTRQLTQLDQQLLIAVDQEGGAVQRLKGRDGFGATPSAQQAGAMPAAQRQRSYAELAKMLADSGINCNFAPVVDLAVNPRNQVVVGYGRTYGQTSAEVVPAAGDMMAAMNRKKIIPVLKHFPGHGSSQGDSHLGFVDVTDTWTEAELEPYRRLIQQPGVEMIMTAHVFNQHLDPRYPATLSYKLNTELLRRQLGFDGVIISDDLQMGAIDAHYSLDQTLALALNAGVDMLLFANQLSSVSAVDLVNRIYHLVLRNEIKLERIEQAYLRVTRLKRRYFTSATRSSE